MYYKIMKNEKGSSLLFVLILIIIITIFFSIFFMIFTLQFKTVKKNIFQTQALYNAESAIYCIIDSLRENPKLELEKFEYKLPWDETSIINVKKYGYYYKVVSQGIKKNYTHTLQVLLAEAPDSLANYALVNTNNELPLTFTGNIEIDGNVLLGKSGYQIKTFKGSKFTGAISGEIFEKDDINNSVYDLQIPNTIEELARKLKNLPDEFLYFDNIDYFSNSKLEQSMIYYSDNDIMLTSKYSNILKEGVTIISKKRIILSDSLSTKASCNFIAKENIILKDEISLKNCIFYSNKYIEIQDSVNCAGQFFAKSKITVSNNADLNFPSLLIVFGEEIKGIRSGEIVIQDSVSFSGTIFYPATTSLGVIDNGLITIDKNAKISGMIYSSNRISFNGILKGSLISNNQYFYEAPVHYINWLRSGNITARTNDIFFRPSNFQKRQQLNIISYERID
ncbi:MAG: hypothetical protein K8S23_05595 [Candidatus Cloacimonetes bacterium]|nr:hypothetical protein [Candidatus Cloacimonadota bacterium]